MAFDMLKALMDVASVTDPRLAASLSILHRGLQDYSQKEMANAAVNVASTGYIPDEVPDRRGFFGGLLQDIGILGDPGMRPLSPDERTGANMGMMMYQAQQDAAKQQELKNKFAELGLLGELGGKYGGNAVAGAEQYLGMKGPSPTIFGTGDSEMDLRTKKFGLLEEESKANVDLAKARAEYYRSGGGGKKGDKGTGDYYGDIAKFVTGVGKVTKTMGGQELADLEARIEATRKALVELETKETTEGLSDEEKKTKQALQSKYVGHLEKRRDLLRTIQVEGLGLPGVIEEEGPNVAVSGGPNTKISNVGPGGAVHSQPAVQRPLTASDLAPPSGSSVPGTTPQEASMAQGGQASARAQANDQELGDLIDQWANMSVTQNGAVAMDSISQYLDSRGIAPKDKASIALSLANMVERRAIQLREQKRQEALPTAGFRVPTPTPTR